MTMRLCDGYVRHTFLLMCPAKTRDAPMAGSMVNGQGFGKGTFRPNTSQNTCTSCLLVDL